MIYQVIIFDERNYIIQYKDFSYLDEDKVMDYATAKVMDIKPNQRVEIKKLDRDMPEKKK